MYKVMIVDDEPAAITYLSTIIEKKCEDFAVSDTAMDGQEALEKMGKNCPDVLFLDIQMPMLNGLEMIQKMKELNLSPFMVIVSGHSQFDYAITAIKNGVVDYLLKPAIPSEVEKLFEKLKKRLKEKYFTEYVQIMRHLCTGHDVEKEEIEKYFGTGNYYIALARQNGLPMRFSSVQGKEVYSDIHEVIYAYGRDERESLYLWPANLVMNSNFQMLAKSRMKKDTTEDGYHTLIYSSRHVNSDNLASTVKKFYRLLDSSIVLGKTHMIDVCNYQEPKWVANEVENAEWRELVYCIEKQNYKTAKEHFTNVILNWKKQERPLLWIETRVRQLSSSILLAKSGEDEKNYQLNEYALEDIFGNSDSYTQLMEGIGSILFPSIETIQKEEKLDTSEFVEQISRFIELHMEENLNVGQISKEFAISPTYLGKLFRKHKNMTMNSFLTSIRMERAKELLEHHSEIMIRELALRVGYQDQFYFSRVFRSYTGVSPSEYTLLVTPFPTTRHTCHE